LGVLLNKCKRRLRKYFKLETLPFIDKVYGENLSLRKGTFCFKSEAVASKFSRGVTLVLGSRKSEEVETSLVYLSPGGEERG
jgi:hypothetical protein